MKSETTNHSPLLESGSGGEAVGGKSLVGKFFRGAFSTERFIYFIAWALLFATPMLMELFRLHHGDTTSLEWHHLQRTYLHLSVYLLLFVVHDCLLAPLMVERGRQGLYLTGAACLIALFTLYECSHRPRHFKDGRRDLRPPRTERFERHDMPPERPRHAGDGNHQPPLPGIPEFMSVVTLVLMLGMNLGVKYYLKQRASEQRMKELERSNLQQRLAYLRYQVNPHFLMNTLNNIHALVDIDPEGAQTAIVELSRMLRYQLYDGDRQMVALQQEVDFLGHYVALMRLRFSNQVDILFEKPGQLPSGSIPPLLLATFVENAFKHGVSYQKASYVHLRLQAAENRLRFTCVNSRRTAPAQEQNTGRGLGLKNARQRLELLFAGNYTLDVQETEDSYAVLLDIPLTHLT